MKYMLLIYADEAARKTTSDAQMRELIAAYTAYSEAIAKSGVLVSADRLQSSDAATTVRVADGNTQVLNGPYAETREQLGGYYLIDVPDLDAALSWAARCPGSGHGTIEVRPVWQM